MKILNLKLKGAIGLKLGLLGLDQIEIDFTQFSEGLVAFSGPSGSGKTTIMENLHPYRQLVSYDGSLASNFFLKDSYRFLTFEHKGKVYESKILIDALTGGGEAYLIENGVPLNDGKLTTYDKAIEELLGTPELFFNSVFSGQKSKGIAELKPADRRKLFYELLNLNSYEVHLEKAKAELKNQELKLAETEGEIRAITNQQADINPAETENMISEKDAEKLATEVELKRVDESMKTAANAIKETEIQIREGSTKLAENVETENALKRIEKEVNSLLEDTDAKVASYHYDIEGCKRQIVSYNEVLSKKEEINAGLASKKELTAKSEQLKSEKIELQSAFNFYQKTYSDKLQEQATLTAKLTGDQLEISKLKSRMENDKSNIERIKKEVKIIDDVPCTEETGKSCRFLINAYGSKDQLNDLEEVTIEAEKNLAEKEAAMDGWMIALRTNKQLLSEKHQIESGKYKEQMEAIDHKLNGLESNLRDINKHNFENLANKLSEAESEIKKLTGDIENLVKLAEQAQENLDARMADLDRQNSELHRKFDPEISEKIDELKQQLFLQKDTHEKLIEDFKKYEVKRTSLISELSELANQTKQYCLNEQKLVTLNGTKRSIELEIKDWAFLCKAFDKTGIPVLKLENSGIEITSIANELLSLFENKFRIVFETTKLKADKKSYKESFDINVIRNKECAGISPVAEIAKHSGGEKTWLETALQLSIMLVAKKQGQDIQTAFLDEKDGGLDLSLAMHYAEMIQKAHQMSGVHNTFVITHRTELLDFIPQQVKLSNGILEVMN